MRSQISHIVVALTAVVLPSGCAVDTLSIQAQAFRLHNTDPVRRVAVVDFAGEAGQAAADMLTMHLERAGFEVVERQYLSDLLGEIDAAAQGRTEATVVERLNKMGKLFNADAVITGDLVKLSTSGFERKAENRLAYEGATTELSVRAFDVRTREVFWTAWLSVTATAKTGEQLRPLDFLDDTCAEVAQSFADPAYQDGRHLYRGQEIVTLRKNRLSGQSRPPGS